MGLYRHPLRKKPPLVGKKPSPQASTQRGETRRREHEVIECYCFFIIIIVEQSDCATSLVLD